MPGVGRRGLSRNVRRNRRAARQRRSGRALRERPDRTLARTTSRDCLTAGIVCGDVACRRSLPARRAAGLLGPLDHAVGRAAALRYALLPRAGACRSTRDHRQHRDRRSRVDESARAGRCGAGRHHAFVRIRRSTTSWSSMRACRSTIRCKSYSRLQARRSVVTILPKMIHEEQTAMVLPWDPFYRNFVGESAPEHLEYSQRLRALPPRMLAKR